MKIRPTNYWNFQFGKTTMTPYSLYRIGEFLEKILKIFENNYKQKRQFVKKRVFFKQNLLFLLKKGIKNKDFVKKIVKKRHKKKK